MIVEAAGQALYGSNIYNNNRQNQSDKLIVHITRIHTLNRQVIPNRCAETHKGAVSKCQWYPQILKYFSFISALHLKVPQIVIFWHVRVPCQIYEIPKGAVNN